MPGSILGKGALVGAIAATDIGQELAGDTLYMGAPAMATNKHDSGGMLRIEALAGLQMPCSALSRLAHFAACLLCAKLHLAGACGKPIVGGGWSHASATHDTAVTCHCCA